MEINFWVKSKHVSLLKKSIGTCYPGLCWGSGLADSGGGGAAPPPSKKKWGGGGGKKEKFDSRNAGGGGGGLFSISVEDLYLGGGGGGMGWEGGSVIYKSEFG